MSERVIRLWDLPIRLFHWLRVVLMAGAVVSVKMGGNAMAWHGRFGQAVLALIVFRFQAASGLKANAVGPFDRANNTAPTTAAATSPES